MRISDCSSDVCSSDLTVPLAGPVEEEKTIARLVGDFGDLYHRTFGYRSDEPLELVNVRVQAFGHSGQRLDFSHIQVDASALSGLSGSRKASFGLDQPLLDTRSEEHTSELQSLMRISYAVFC